MEEITLNINILDYVKKDDFEKQIELVMILQKKIDELLYHSKAIDFYKSHICEEYNLQQDQSHGII